MDPLSALASGMQVGVQCTKAIVSLAQWIEQVKTVDDRIQAFQNELITLRTTYTNLDSSLKQPSMRSAAKAAQQTAGGRLWSQIKRGLEDCQQTLININKVLESISKKSRFGRPLKQLREHLSTGELSRLRSRIQMFNSTLSLPLQMMMVMNQLDQQSLTADQHRQLDDRILDLSQEIRNISTLLRRSLKSMSVGDITLIGSENPESVVYNNITSLAIMAEKFVSGASAAASTKASTWYTPSTIHAGELPASVSDDKAAKAEPIPIRRLSTSGPLTTAEQVRIEQWIKPPDSVISSSPMPTDNQSMSVMTRPTTVGYDDESDDDDSDVNLILTTTFLKNGAHSNEQRDYARAEENFRQALKIFDKTDFGDALAIQAADVVLMVSQACLDQNKLDEAIDLLLPMSTPALSTRLVDPTKSVSGTEGSGVAKKLPDRFQALAADHMLGEAFLRKSDFTNAEKYSLSAFRGRRRRAAQQQAKYLESVTLVIEVYKAKGEDAVAEAYQGFLQQGQEATLPLFTISKAESEDTIDPLQREDTAASKDVSSPPKASRKFAMPFRKDRTGTDLSKVDRDNRPSLSGQQSPSEDVIPWVAMATSPLAHTTTAKEWRSASTASSPPAGGAVIDSSDVMSNEDVSLTSTVSGQSLEARFMAIQKWSRDGKYKNAWKSASVMMQSYDNTVWIHRQDELERNIKRGGQMGLASSGHGYSPLHFFAGLKNESVNEVKLLVDAGANVNAIAYRPGYNSGPKFTPFQLAVKNGHANVVRLMLAIPSVNTQVKDEEGCQPILVACRNRYYNIVNQLLDHGPPPSADSLPAAWFGNSLLHDASKSCDTRLVKLLLARKFDANLQDRYGKTPLMHAVIKCDISNTEQRQAWIEERLDCVRILLEAGADMTLQDLPLSSSARAGRDSASDVGSVRPPMTVLDHAAQENDPELVALLNRYRFRGHLMDFSLGS